MSVRTYYLAFDRLGGGFHTLQRCLPLLSSLTLHVSLYVVINLINLASNYRYLAEAQSQGS